jgi:pyruvate dehydrogenase (quinone)
VLDQAFATAGPVVIEATVDPFEPMMPPRMPPDYARNFRKALPATPGHEHIEANVGREPLRSMLTAGETKGD